MMSRPFVIVFLASNLPDECGPTFDFLRTLLLSLPLAIHKRLKGFYLVHPTLKMRFTFTFLGAALWGKLHFVDELRKLRALPAGQPRRAEFVAEADHFEILRRRSSGRAGAALAPTAAAPGAAAPGAAAPRAATAV